MIQFDERMFASIVEFILVILFLWIIRAIFRILVQIPKSIIHLLSGHRKDPLQSQDWLIRSQAKQEIRFNNSLPPLMPKTKSKKKKRHFWQRKEGNGWYATGWTFNEKTGLWEPPDYL